MSGTPYAVGQRRRAAGTAGAYLAASLAAVLFLIPFYLLVRNGLATDAEITSPDWTFFPTELRWGNLAEVFQNPAVPFARSLWNSTVVAVLHTVGTLLICSLAGYGLARVPYRHANKVFYAVLVTLMIPGAVTFVPSFVLVSSLGWVSSLRGLIIPGLFSGFTVFLFRQYFLNFPKELEEAARVDGLGYWGAYWRIVLPNSLNFTAAIAVITFITGWNSFLWPLVIGQDQQSWTVQVALSSYLTAQTINIHELFVAAAISILPLVVVFVFLQRWLVEGVAQTGIKG
ncbi:carbohydrate ABC transporter permease [Solwaraspora sp. WMMD1047]|uniref:carbohydrate ABC transporter permease n=1 Tax=Solwaraspora sp. WMMD1047 TaxID=3016102 RepID=UPI0024165631|nr:carbohydrate ABC transporter permease [Solwaraspora sp. WMMD1047]MDG4831321.1 carbohydrate ABC transporter permease [Solwaraspora sp. WMMD1047]